MSVAGVIVPGFPDLLPHEGYDERETPTYGVCMICAAIVRADRADLLREHFDLHKQGGLPCSCTPRSATSRWW